ncbi:MAG: hypothetical protein ABIY35_07565 [Chitinophagaceae bacterium]
MKHLLLFLILLISFQSYSQNMGWRNGLIVTQKSDTIMCLLPITLDFGKVVAYKLNNEQYEKYMSIKDIKYLATETSVYENIGYLKKGKEIHKIMWLQEEGKLNLYTETQAGIGSPRSFAGGTFTPFNKLDLIYVLKKDGINYVIDPKKFVESITPLIADNDELVKKVVAKEYTYENIGALINEYNTAATKE